MLYFKRERRMEKPGLYLLLLIGSVSSQHDIVTLWKENEVICITQDVTLPTFIFPPVLENSTKSLSLLTGEDWTCDNWSVIEGSNSSSGSVFDKRWENFEVIKTNSITFTSAQSASFSLHSPMDVQLHVSDYENLDYIPLKEFKEGWNHISILLRNNSVLYLLNNKVIKSTDQFNPHEIAVKIENDTFLKIHNYHFMMSENVTDGKPARLTIPHTENPCFLLYVSLCEKCVLAIPELNRIYNSTNDSNNLNSWHVDQLEIKTGIENLSFCKTTTDHSTLGYWGIDLHECPTNNIAYKVNTFKIEENNYLCHILNHENEIEPHMEKNNRSVNAKSCEDQNCKCFLGYGNTYHKTSQEKCKWACKLCNNITDPDLTKVIKEPIRTDEVFLNLIKIVALALLVISILIIIYCLFHQTNPEHTLIKEIDLTETARDEDILTDNNGFEEV